jgi:chromosome transmission fidelity protein 18
VLIEKNTDGNVTEQRLQPIIKVKSAPVQMNSNKNFLLVGAKNAKASRSARTAARVGCIVAGSHHQSSNRHDQTNEQKRLSNTGSDILLSQVVRLKYVKGFTQAVSMPCRLDDIS